MAQPLVEPSRSMDDHPLTTRLWLSAGAIGPLLFITVFLITGATRAGYTALRYPVSSLAIGDLGWIQTANFLMIGTLLCVFAGGVRRALRGSRGSVWGPLLIGLAGIGLFGAGVFTSDPVYGYPASAPLALAQFTTHGHLHDVFSLLFFIGLPAACFVFCRRFGAMGQWGWVVYSILSGMGMLVAFGLAGKGFTQTPSLVNVAGVFQRLSISIGLIWIALLAFHLLSQKSPGVR